MVEITKRYYANLTDGELRKAAERAIDLTDVALSILKDEIERRNLPYQQLIADAYLKAEYMEHKIEQRCNEIRDQPCPICGNEEYKLNGIWLTTVISFLATRVKKQFHIGCYDCLMKLKQDAEDKTSLLVWWGFWGLFETPSALKANDKAAEELKEDKPSSALWDYVSKKVGKPH